jgi:hypothetical protein
LRREGPLGTLSRQTARASEEKKCAMVRPRTTTDDDDQPMTIVQAATLKRLAQDAYELDAFKANLTRAEAKKRIIMLTAKLKLLGEPPHTL